MCIRRLRRDEGGGVLVEATVMLVIIFVFVLGAVDFLFAFYQWNAAVKAVQSGTRIAAVVDPLTNGLNALSNAVVSDDRPLGDPMPHFKVECASGSCSCTGTCTGVGGYNATAMNWIVYGRGNASCGSVTSYYRAGMCHFFSRVTPANVSVTYEQTGLGFAGRTGGPVPTITVTLQNLNFQFFFLGGLMGFGNIPIQPVATMSGEDLASSGS
jgi:Flp pilus assembly protein TadG